MNETKYIEFNTLQNILAKNYLKHNPLNIQKLYDLLGPEDWSEKHVVRYSTKKLWDNMSDLEFEQTLEHMHYRLNDPGSLTKDMKDLNESTIFSMQPFNSNILIYHHYNYLLDCAHSHSFFEIYYVFRGSCKIHFEETDVELEEGGIIFIAPHAMHSVESNEDNFILCICIKESNFESLFYQQLSQNNILSVFFRNIIYNKAKYGYILFNIGQNTDIKSIIKNMTMGSYQEDQYNLLVNSSWITILFSTLLRNYYATIQTYPPLACSNFSYILQYIISNYQTVTLDELCSLFNYSKPYLCGLIKKNTGHTFTYLVDFQKLDKAASLLSTTDYTIEEITQIVGFNSCDYFSRLFKRMYGQSPGKYRSQAGESYKGGYSAANSVNILSSITFGSPVSSVSKTENTISSARS